MLVREMTPVVGAAGDYDDLLHLVGDRRFVLLGEASHGSHEFYRERARITRRLIDEKRFDAVAVEADWPDAYRVNRFVMGQSDDRVASSALGDFERFPAWMWRNRDMGAFVDWLHVRNAAHADHRSQVRFYGLDLYSLRSSMQAVVRYLDERDPDAAARARARYSCFDHVGGEGAAYGKLVALEVALPCEEEVVAQLVDLRNASSRLLARDGWVAEDEFFFAEQNAKLVHQAEAYYREMYRGRVSSWNLRDRHMAATLEALVTHLDRQVGRAKVVVWEHNSHVGDARATELGSHGELNVGQLVRQQWPGESVLVGFTTDHGTVTAATEWGGPAERKNVRPSMAGSYEREFHETGVESFLLPMLGHAGRHLAPPRLERAIGVIYRPETERASHWFHASLPAQFDAIVHVDRTSAVEPFERTALWDRGEPPETYPTGL
jgi:erythromycin esterase-like protein